MTWDTELNGWGEVGDDIIDFPEVTPADSEIIHNLMRQIRKGTYKEITLIKMLSNSTKGERPKYFKMRDIAREIKRVGNRWGVSYDSINDVFLVWGGGEPAKGYIPAYTGPVEDSWKAVAEDIVRHMPDKIFTFGTFRNYFTVTAKTLGYARKYCIIYIIDCILQKRLPVGVIVMDGKVDVQVGRARKVMRGEDR